MLQFRREASEVRLRLGLGILWLGLGCTNEPKMNESQCEVLRQMVRQVVCMGTVCLPVLVWTNPLLLL